MNINDKIKQILIEKNLSPSHFADEIGVQRSSISHILSGRNRPSFDIIQKIIRRFPDLGFDWILEEDPAPQTPTFRSPNRFTDQRAVGNQPQGTSLPERTTSFPSTFSTSNIRSQRTEIPPMTTNAYTDELSQQPLGERGQKSVERILIFYSDGTFREYSPM